MEFEEQTLFIQTSQHGDETNMQTWKWWELGHCACVWRFNCQIYQWKEIVQLCKNVKCVIHNLVLEIIFIYIIIQEAFSYAIPLHSETLHLPLSRSVRELSSFVQDTAHGLSNKVSDGDYAGLVDIMGHLMAIRDRQISNEQHFRPLKSTAELLKTYGQQLPESVYTQLEVCTNAQIRTFPWVLADMHIYHDITFFTLLPQNAGAAGEVEESEENCIHS